MDEKTEMQRWLETDKLWMLVSKGRLIYIRPGQSDLIHVLNHYFTSWRLPLAKYTDLSFIDSFLSTCLIPLYQPGCNTLKAYPVPKTINKWFHLDIIIIPFYWCQNGGTEIKFLGQGHRKYWNKDLNLVLFFFLIIVLHFTLLCQIQLSLFLKITIPCQSIQKPFLFSPSLLVSWWLAQLLEPKF